MSMTRSLLAASLLPIAALADTPAFDRPGIGFGTTVLPRGTLAWEQGLPDVTRQKDAGVTTTQYDAGTLIRYGLHDRVELQLGGSPYSRLDTKGAGGNDREEGSDDLSLALKAALPAASDGFSWALLAGASLPTGNEAFSRDRTQYFAGITTAFELDDRQAVALYYNIAHDSTGETFSFSPSWSLQLNDRLGLYVEAGLSTGSAQDDDYVAGGGLTYMLTPRVQADLYGLRGLGARSTDLQTGFGLSVFFD